MKNPTQTRIQPLRETRRFKLWNVIMRIEIRINQIRINQSRNTFSRLAVRSAPCVYFH